MSISPDVRAGCINIIDNILVNSDLNSVTEKHVRNGIQEKVDFDVTPHKAELRQLIYSRFDIFAAKHAARESGDNAEASVQPPEPPLREASRSFGAFGEHAPIDPGKRLGDMDQSDIERSMARRKKGYIPPIVDMPCSHKDCDKVFHRKCDLAKHEKTHTRPYKCSNEKCKYHELGLPTEKELARHIQDKHATNPILYACDYEGCGFKTKRESNLGQHRKQKHGLPYVRRKANQPDHLAPPSVDGATADHKSPQLSHESGNDLDHNAFLTSLDVQTDETFLSPRDMFDSNDLLGSPGEHVADFGTPFVYTSTTMVPHYETAFPSLSIDTHLPRTQFQSSSVVEASPKFVVEDYVPPSSALSFACPYAKFDPTRYSEKNLQELHYRGCGLGSYRSISRVIAHLKRVHFRPAYDCRQCFEGLRSQDELNRHSRMLCPSRACPYPEKVDKSQRERLLGLSLAGNEDDDDTWFEIYEILFRGDPPPATSRVEFSDGNNVEQTTKTDSGADFMLFGADHDPILQLSHLPAATDSGYASMTPLNKFKVDQSGDLNMDTMTVYSSISMETTRREGVVQNFAERIFKDIGCGKLDASAIEILTRDLPALLADFALRLGQDTSHQELREAMIFIHRYRSSLSASLGPLFVAGSDEEEDQPRRALGESMSMEEKMKMWRYNFDPHNEPDPLPQDSSMQLEMDDTDEAVNDETDTIQDFAKHIELVSINSSYEWLIAQLRDRLSLTYSDNDVLNQILQEVQTTLPKATHLKTRCPPIFHAALEVRWALRQFLKEQFGQDDAWTIAQLVTITMEEGLGDAQASTCMEYMIQCWPVTGIYLIRLIQQLAGLKQMEKQYIQRPDGAVLEAYEATSLSIVVEVTGSYGVIAEVAHQLAWLSSTLRTAPSLDKSDIPGNFAFVCTPSVKHNPISPASSAFGNIEIGIEQLHIQKPNYTTQQDDPIRHQPAIRNQKRTTYHFRVDSEFDRIDKNDSEGTCWSQMIQNPTVVRGYPIRRREQPRLGLELSLNLMADLVGTKYVNTFNGNVFIKGYSAMLFPVKLAGDVLVWHLVCNDSRKHISYLDHKLDSVCSIDVDKIASYRHVVGWCSNALNYAGAADSQFPIRRARLPRAGAHCILADDDISFGKPITGEGSPILLKQHTTVHTQRTGYLDIFRYLSQHFVLLWDKRDERGWLVNGINALLHLLRTSLRIDERDSVGSDFILKSTDLKEPKRPYSPRAAREFLSELDNLRAKISITKTSVNKTSTETEEQYELLTDRMEQYYHVLEKALTYSRKLQKSIVETAKTTRRRSSYKLEGWDFADLANKTELVEACAMTLPSCSHSWLGLVQSLSVTTLFGQGFGELIQPSSSNCCATWRTLPTGKHYVAVNMADLTQIMELKGDPDAEPRLLSDSILWHHPKTAFESCGCADKANINTKLIQQLCSTLKTCVCPKVSQEYFDLDEYMGGAVILGHNPAYGLPPVDADEDDFEDSGLGSSLAATSTRDTNLTGGSISPQPTIHREAVARQYGDSSVYRGVAHYGDNVQIYNYHSLDRNEAWPSYVQYSQDARSTLHNEQQIGTKRRYENDGISEPEIAGQCHSESSTGAEEQISRKRSKLATASQSSHS